MLRRLSLFFALCLVWTLVYAAVPTVGTTKTSNRIVTSVGNLTNSDVSHIIDASTTLVVVDVITSGADTGTDDSNFSVTWDIPTANESLTRVNLPTRTSKTANDPHIQSWALLSPTAKTANMNFALSVGSYQNVVVHITNYLGTSVASLGAAIAFVADAVNLADSSTCTIASGGTAGNLLYAVTAFKGTDTDPLTLSASWTSISTMYTTSGTADWASHLANKSAASAITFTGTGTDPDENNMCVLFEIAPPLSSAIPIFIAHSRRRTQ